MPVRPVRWSLVLSLLFLPFASSVGAQKPPALPDLLKLAGESLAQYANQLGSVAADEEFMQFETTSGQMSTPKRVNSVVVLHGTQDGTLHAFRDVVAIDTVPVRAKDDRLAGLFKNPTQASITNAESMTEEAVRAYFGQNLHLLDNPLLALDLLRTANQDKTTFKVDGMKKVNGVQTAVLKFNENGKGRLVNGGSYVGRYWIDPATGAIHQTEMGFVLQVGQIHATVKFTKDTQLDLLVPSELSEQAQMSSPQGGLSNMGGGGQLAGRQSLEGRAGYTGYRRVRAQQ